MSGEYSESLPCGGKLIVRPRSWTIQYYFPGPDLRHRGEFKHIDGASIDKYIVAFRAAWQEYLKLQANR